MAKTKTSTEVKNRWNKAHYKKIIIQLDSGLIDRFREKCKRDGIAQAAIIREAIKNYLGE